MTKYFRPCAGAVVFNDKGLVLLCNRNDVAVSSWQFPQGGIEEGETPLAAAQRELFEETSIISVIPVYTDIEPNTYEFPDEIKQNFKNRGIVCDGQNIHFSLFYFTGKDDEINVKTPHPEFKEYDWKDFDFAVQNIIDFKKEVYLGALCRLKPIIAQYLDNLS